MILCIGNAVQWKLSSSLLGPFVLLKLDMAGSAVTERLISAGHPALLAHAAGNDNRLTVPMGWQLSRGCGLQHLQVMSSVFSLTSEGFLTSWVLFSK